jgi:hypothetical protein
MNFTEVVAEVISIVKRPDKLLDIRREVNKAISFCCLGADFARDLEEASIAIDSTLFAQNIDLTTLTRFRKFEYIKPPGRAKFLRHLTPDKIFAKGREDVDVYYIAGDQANFKLCKLSSTLLVGYFKFPPTLSDASPTFWLLDIAPYMIIDKAASAIFRNIGDDASSKRHEDEFALQYVVATRDFKYGATPG